MADDPADLPDRPDIRQNRGRKLNSFTPRVQRCIEKRLEDPNKSESQIAREIGVGSTRVHDILRQPGVVTFLSGFLDANGATLNDSARVIGEAHTAKKVKVFAYKGQIVADEARPDHDVRLRGAELNLRARGKLKDGADVNVNIYGGLTDEQLAQIATKQKSVADFIDVTPGTSAI